MADPSLLKETIVAQFRELLNAITGSKDSIQKATKQVMENPSCSETLIDIIGDKLSESQNAKTMPLFFLLDSIAQNASKSKRRNVVRKVGECLKQQIKFVLESPGREANIPRIEKTITIWKARDIFSPDVVRSVVSCVENGKAQDNMTEDEKILRRIEEIRRTQKAEQMKACLRSLNEDPFAEMEEMMDSIDVSEIIKNRRLSKQKQLVQQTKEKSPEKLVGQKRVVVAMKNSSSSVGSGALEYNPNEDYYVRKPHYPPSGYHMPHGYPYDCTYQQWPAESYRNASYQQYDYPQSEYDRYQTHSQAYDYESRKQSNTVPNFSNQGDKIHQQSTGGEHSNTYKNRGSKTGPTKRQTQNTSTTYFTQGRSYKGKNPKGKKKKQKKENLRNSGPWEIPSPTKKTFKKM